MVRSSFDQSHGLDRLKQLQDRPQIARVLDHWQAPPL